MTLPHRPRLAEHAWLRRHRVQRDSETDDVVVLHDARGGPLIKLDARVGELLLCADGTRDVDGIALAASREGIYRGIDELRALLEGLHARGLLAEGTDSPSVDAASAPKTPLDRPLARLDFTLVCDGSGVCCTQYMSYAFSEIESMRARVLLPNLPHGAPQRRLFSPLEGSTPRGTFAVAAIDGRCAYLRDDGACGIHAAGGAEAKPLSCRLYPVTLFDDGVVLRASVRPECVCVFASVGRADGAPLIDPRIETAGDLKGGAIVRVLPETLPLTRARSIDRVAWSEISATLATLAPAHDAAATYWALADVLAREPFDRSSARDAFEARTVPRDAGRWIEALARHAEHAARAAEQWRSPNDRARIGRALVADAARSLASATSFPSAALPADESFHLRASLFGHLVAERAPIVDALRDRAVRLIVARPVQHEPHPLALVETMARAHGLDAYVFSLETR